MKQRRCERLIWRRGQNRACGQVVGVQTWKDAGGREHAGCQLHIEGLMFTYPEAPVTLAMSERAAVRTYDR